MTPFPVVIMGVSGCGKSTVASHLARALDRAFVDADDLHPRENREKMAAGIPLNDADRLPWLDDVAVVLERDPLTIAACSALKRSYRDRLRDGAPGLGFVYLSGDPETVAARLRARTHQFMSPTLLGTQFEILEPPAGEPRVLHLDILQPVAALVEAARSWLDAVEHGDGEPASPACTHNGSKGSNT